MVKESHRRSTEWKKYEGMFMYLVFEDGVEKDGSPHLSIKKGIVDKVTKTHVILKKEPDGYEGINNLRIVRFSLKPPEMDTKWKKSEHG